MVGSKSSLKRKTARHSGRKNPLTSSRCLRPTARESQMNDKLQHATITLQHSYSAPLERVFCEFADPVARARWSAPSKDELIYDEANFQIGGKDVFRCGSKGAPKFRGETRYLEIVPNARV